MFAGRSKSSFPFSNATPIRSFVSIVCNIGPHGFITHFMPLYCFAPFKPCTSTLVPSTSRTVQIFPA
eukprot:UN03898